MCAVPIKGLHKDDLTLTQMKKIQQEIKRRIPVGIVLIFEVFLKNGLVLGFNSHADPLKGAIEALDEISDLKTPTKRLESEFRNRRKIANQLGTLGGGNHFLEVSLFGPCLFVILTTLFQIVHDETGNVWIMLHSGSRNIGNTSAMYHDNVAKELLRRQGIRVAPGLNYLRINSKEGQEYLKDMEWCQG